jgi:regulator of sigma D
MLVTFSRRVLQNANLFVEVDLLSGLEGFSRDNLNAKILAAFCNEVLGLDYIWLGHDRHRIRVRIVLIMRSLVLIEEREVWKNLAANVAFETNV